MRLIGEGATGSVYEAVDERFDRRIAIKRLRAVTAETILDLKEEFRRLSEVAHPNLVELGELVVTGDEAYFSMEFLQDCSAHLANLSVDERRAEITRVASDVGAGLHTLHQLGKLHRDLKPSNILRDAAGRWKIADYGLVARRSATGERFSGTPAYACPHALLFGHSSPATDWYSLGVTLYELATGRLPFAQRTLEETVVAKQRARFERSALEEAAGRDLAHVIERLLDPNPAVRAGYESIATLGGAVMVTRPRPASSGSLVGRERELAELSEAWAAAQSGTVVVCVAGASGIGKTALIDHFVSSLDQASEAAWILSGRCRPEEHVGSRAMDRAIDDLVVRALRMREADRERLFRGAPAILGRLFPVLSPFLARDLERDLVDPLEARAHAVDALVSLVGRIARERPLAVIVDDAHWADDEDLALLSALAGGGHGLLIVLTTRPSGAARVQQRMSAAADVRAMTLSSLSPEASTVLLARLGASFADDESARALAREAEGSPLLLEEVALELAGAAPAPERTLDALLARRVRDIDEGERLLLELIALRGRALRTDEAIAIVGDSSSVGDRLARLVKRKLARWEASDAEEIAVYHDRVREAVSGAMSATERVDRHAALLDALLARGTHDPEELLDHAVGAKRSALAFELASAAATNAFDRFAFAAAVRHLETALAHAQPQAAAALNERLGRARALCGRGVGAAEALLAAARSTQNEDHRLELELAAATSLLRTGHSDQGRSSMRSVLERLGARLPSGPAEAVLAFLYWRARAAPVFARRGSRRPLTVRDRLRLDALWAGATTLSMSDPVIASALQSRLIAEAQTFDDPVRRLRADALQAAFLAALGGRNRAAATSLLRDLERDTAAQGGAYERAWMEATLGSVAWLGGDPKSAVRHTMRSRALFSELKELSPYELSLVDAWLLPALAQIGDLSSLREILSITERAAMGRNDVFALATCRLGHPTLGRLVSDGPEQVRRRADEALALCGGPKAPPTPLYHHTIAVVQAHLYEGRADLAHAHLARAWPRLSRARLFDLEMIAADLWFLRARTELWAASAGHISEKTARRTARRVRERLERSTLAIRRAWSSALTPAREPGADPGAPWQEIGLELHASIVRGDVPDADATRRALFVPS